jgi:uncharacterized protein (TIGR02646 family)
MIGLVRSAKPTILASNDVAWNAEYVAWSQHRTGTEPRRYGHQDIRAALAADTSSKCAYCEGRVNDVSYVHVEHQLPKKHHPELVCEWNNLTLGCPRCNTSKGAYDDDALPILDPYSDDAESDVAFGGPLALPRGGARARTTINVLDLNRMELLHSRGESLRRIDDLLDLIERVGDNAELVRSLWTDVDRLTSANAEFASASRYFVKAQCSERGLVRP